MAVLKSQAAYVHSTDDLLSIRQLARQWAMEIGFSLVDQTKLITAASELARNILDHGGGSGTVLLESLTDGLRAGLRLTFQDKGPGIADVEAALKGGYTTRGGMGLGLSGAKRLVNEFELETKRGEGTRVTITRWK